LTGTGYQYVLIAMPGFLREDKVDPRVKTVEEKEKRKGERRKEDMNSEVSCR
jgi:hypothetical protein